MKRNQGRPKPDIEMADKLSNKTQVVNKASSSKQAGKTSKEKGKTYTLSENKVSINFEDNEEQFQMEVEAEDDQQFESGSENENDAEVSFRQRGRNNNASPMQEDCADNTESDSDGEIVTTDSEDDTATKDGENTEESCLRKNAKQQRNAAKDNFVSEMMNQRHNKTKEEFVDVAVAKFQEVFMKSGFLETANKLQKKLDEVESMNRKMVPEGQRERLDKKGNEGEKSKAKQVQGKVKAKIDDMLSRASVSELFF